MILGLGIDLLEVARLERAVARHGERFLEHVMGPDEVVDRRGRRYPMPVLAGHFAAKEALFKALGTGWTGKLSWRQIEVDRAERVPAMKLTGHARHLADRRGVERIHLGLGHDERYAIATVVLER